MFGRNNDVSRLPAILTPLALWFPPSPFRLKLLKVAPNPLFALPRRRKRENPGGRGTALSFSFLWVGDSPDPEKRNGGGGAT